MSLLIKNGRVVDPKNGVDKVCDLLISRGKISRIESNIGAGDAEVIDASKKVVLPGLIDMHTHLREPGREDEETVLSGSRAAARGGFTAVCPMANTDPVTDNQGAVEFLLRLARSAGLVRVYPVGAITKCLEGEELAPIGELKNAGAVAVSDDGMSVASSEVMRHCLEYAGMFGLPVISHAEDLNLSGGGVMNEGITSTELGMKGIPASSETIMVARDLELARMTGARLHFAHLSCAGSVELVRRAKKEGLAVTAETCPHYFSLSEETIKSFNTYFKVKPPLRTKKDVDAIKKGLADGTIDVIATDHAPHTPDEKAVAFDLAPFGINGLETAVALILDKLVSKNIISLNRFIEMISTAPARILGLENKGKLERGADADITILNLRKEFTVDVNRFRSKSRNSPFHGWKLRGGTDMTIVGGKIVYAA